jgi:uncharacterized protein
MSGVLPAYIQPVRLAELGRTLEGRLPLARMRRLADMLSDRGGEAAVRLEFRREGRGRATVRGTIRAGLRLTCQRCLEPFELILDLPVRLVRSDVEAGRLAEEEDPLLVDEDQALSLAELVEDELLLALPQVPAHPPPGCRVLAEGEASAESRPSPFSALAELEAPGPAARAREPKHR